MLSTPLICCSSGVATACARVCESAPTYVARIWISGGAMLGNCATGRLRRVSEPTRTRTMEITIATIGRLMKNFDMTLPAHRFRAEWFRVDLDPGANFLDSFDDYSVTWIEPTGNHPAPIHLCPHCHRANGYFVASVNNCYLITALELRDRSLRNQQRPLVCPDYRTNFGITAGFQDVVGIGEESGNAD